MQRHLKIHLITLSIILSVIQLTHSADYNFTKIDFPGADETWAAAINDVGQIVGFYTNDVGGTGLHGFLINGDNFQTIDFPGSIWTEAWGINDAGQIVGEYGKENDGIETTHGFSLNGNSFQTIDFPGALWTSVWGINDTGQIVGWYGKEDDGIETTHGFLLNGNNFQTIDFPGLLDLWVGRGINDAGQIVANYLAGGYNAFLLDGESFSTINFPGATETYVGGINDSGQILGTYDDGDEKHLFLLEGNNFSTIDVPVAFNLHLGQGINDAGQIVGTLHNDSSFIATKKCLSIIDFETMEDTNETSHHTNLFKTDKKLILRRGDLFNIILTLPSPYDPENYNINFEREHYFNESLENLEVPVFEQEIPVDEWGARIVTVTENPDQTKNIEIQFNIPPNAPIGDYLFKTIIDEIGGVNNPCNETYFPKPVVILFNPWSEHDTVYMPDEMEKDEYVLRNYGYIWRGEANAMRPKSWRFSQFDQVSLEVSLDLLNGLSAQNRSNPVIISRHLLAQTNSKGSNGILEGKWARPKNTDESEEEYKIYLSTVWDGGIDPAFWTGSDQILNRFQEGGSSGPVKYAQCWVFGGVLTTILRCLGIPARPITNFKSAWDKDYPTNKSVDVYCTELECPDRNRTIDDWFNFHVWCEARMKRDDWSDQCGWQAVDATPLRLSDDDYRLGPAPVTAVRDDLGGNYDVDFVFSEVDADIKYWWKVHNKDLLKRTDQTTIGQNITTKSIGSGTPKDITSYYKTSTTMPTQLETNLDSGIDVSLDIPSSVDMGSDIVWTVSLHNTSAMEHSVKVMITGDAVNYNGTYLTTMDKVDTTLNINSGETETVQLLIPESTYSLYTKVTHFFEVSVGIQVIDTSDVFLDQRTTLLVTPEITVDCLPEAKINQNDSAECRGTWTNPFSSNLTDAVITYAVGSSLSLNGASEVQINVGSITPGQTIQVSQEVQGIEIGMHPVSAVLKTKELSGVNGDTLLEVLLRNFCKGDFEPDGDVDGFDLSFFVTDFGRNDCDAGDPCKGDYDGDGDVDESDLTSFSADFGKTYCP